MSVFDEIKLGISQAIEYEKGNLEVRTTKISIAPLEEFSSSEIKEIRKRAGLTQVTFAKFLGVSLKTVEAWEAGRNHPSGTACRLIALTNKDPKFPVLSGIIVQ